MRALRAVTALALILGAGNASAVDKWDTPSSLDCADDERVTCNELWHGSRQTHDVQDEGAFFRDNDWMVAETKAGHSYEVRLVSSNLQLATPLWPTAVTLKRWAAVSELQSGSAPNGTGPVFDAATSLVLRWLADSLEDRREWIHVRALAPNLLTLTASDQYEVELLDTTYFASRWNQVGTQSSVFLVQNVSSAPVEGKIYFYDSDANLAFTQPFSIARNGLYVVSTGSLAPLAGKSGSAAVVHTGGYGALAGKVVSLEPATGFTFDTPLEPVPR